ncbi:hypothetical protein EJ03DRAFT_354672 [Teratosphaeria nubilosa]|uniref:Amidohydrolase-related domain-containing protein n=1 Tax=Teratosphaeria nubilosa TaxID=161662 RepID=A0A6G1KZM5_9PEZI|nr:hypothetical protein EJ03DRAFT_354672 [Teratosphaeria nubilosa]
MTRKHSTVPAQPPAPIDIHSPKHNEVRIDTDLLIPGRGSPIEDASLIFHPETGTILFAGLITTTHAPVLMPGLWDTHVHFFGSATGDLDDLALLPPSLAGVRSARDLAATLNAGYTSVREVGGYGIDMAKAVDEGWIPGPKIYAAGAPIS